MIQKTEWVLTLTAKVISSVPVTEIEAVNKLLEREGGSINRNGLAIVFFGIQSKEKQNDKRTT